MIVEIDLLTIKNILGSKAIFYFINFVFSKKFFIFLNNSFLFFFLNRFFFIFFGKIIFQVNFSMLKKIKISLRKIFISIIFYTFYFYFYFLILVNNFQKLFFIVFCFFSFFFAISVFPFCWKFISVFLFHCFFCHQFHSISLWFNFFFILLLSTNFVAFNFI